MRAREPDHAGTVEVDGVTIAYETFGDRGPAVILMPTWCVVHSRAWKFQVPYLSRHFRVVTWDGPGNGASSRSVERSPYTAAAHVEYALAVLDAAGIDRATAVASSGGTHRTLLLAADHPDRIESVAFVGPLSYLVEDPPNEIAAAFVDGDLDRFIEVFMAAAFNEPHSTKAFEDGVEWGHGTTMEILLASRIADHPDDLESYIAACKRIEQRVLVIQGSEDRLTPPHHGRILAETIGDNAELVMIEGGGHRTDIRDSVRFSLLLRDFVRAQRDLKPQARPWIRGTARAPRALYISSPIGLGHARRDLAIARELRKLKPELEIAWLAQDPVTRMLGEAGELVHPASHSLVSESAHIAGESDGHDLHCFQAWRRMDEILAANFMVLHDLLDAEHFDLIVGDEAWEVDHFLHENPELKRGAFVWLTDFVGWLPTEDGDPGDAPLAADYNAEMVEHVARYPWVRDLSLFVGNPDDIVPQRLGPDLPMIREWTEEHFHFTGYIGHFRDGGLDSEALRAELGVEDGERLCIASVGGSGVGSALLDAIVDACTLVRKEAPDVRLVVVAGPRIEPRSLSVGDDDGVTVTGYVPHLHKHLAICDLAIVQAGLTTTMELTASGRPFLYAPLRRHFEQQIHVPYRLDRYRAGRRIDACDLEREAIAAALLEELGRECDYLPVETDGAKRAASLIATLV